MYAWIYVTVRNSAFKLSIQLNKTCRENGQFFRYANRIFDQYESFIVNIILNLPFTTSEVLELNFLVVSSLP